MNGLHWALACSCRRPVIFPLRALEIRGSNRPLDSESWVLKLEVVLNFEGISEFLTAFSLYEARSQMVTKIRARSLDRSWLILKLCCGGEKTDILGRLGEKKMKVKITHNKHEAGIYPWASLSVNSVNIYFLLTHSLCSFGVLWRGLVMSCLLWSAANQCNAKLSHLLKAE